MKTGKIPPKSILLLTFTLLTLFSCEALIDFDPPKIEIISPMEGDTYSGTLPCELEVTDNYVVKQVEVFIDDESVYLFTEEPYSTDIDITTSQQKSATLKVKAHDRAGNWAEATQELSIAPEETITTPNKPTGTISGNPNTSYSYSTGGSTSSLGHSLEYRFDWGDGSYSNWSSSTSASHSWSSAGTYYVKAQARCATHTSAVSSWSSSKTVTFSEPTETVSIPSTPSGNSSGDTNTSYSYSTGGASSSLGHSIQYRFDWGDGSYSSWSSSTSASHSWSSAGTYSLKAQARCASHTSVVSSWSSAKSVTISSETVSTPNMPSGNSSGDTNTSYSYSTGGASSSLGHSIQYRFDWRDGNFSNWSSSTSASHSWSSGGTYYVKAQARCATHTSVVSSWSSSKTVTISGSQTTEFEAPFSSTIPTIDGVLNASEWAGANVYDITLVSQDGADSHAGTLYLQHDNTWLYLGVNSGFGSGWDVHWVFRFDGNHDHILAGSASEPHIDLQMNYPSPGAWSGYNNYDYFYGTSDAVASEPPGTARASAGTDPVTYEFNVKISDLGSEPGQIIGFYTYHGCDGAACGYYYPGGASLSNPAEWPHINLK